LSGGELGAMHGKQLKLVALTRVVEYSTN